MSNPDASRRSRATRANSGVPAKMIFKADPVLGRVTGRRGRAGCGTGAGFRGTDYPADARPASGALFLELLEQLGLDAVALEWRQVFHEDLAQKVVHFMLDADRQHPVGLDRA